MNMIRRKMTECRRKADKQEQKNITVVRARTSPKTWKGKTLLSARDSKPEDIQEKLIPVVVGADVEALYPSLADLDTALICYNAVMESEIEFLNINYKLATKYIAICLTETELMLSPIAKILPRRTTRSGTRPGVTSLPGNDENWSYPTQEFTKIQRKTIVATMVQIGVLTMMNTHLYEFGGKIFLQKDGGPIGLRATCAVARVVMNFWDAKWMNVMEENQISRDLEDRYMDDIRVILMALKAGWRWLEDGFYWWEEWQEEDMKSEVTQEDRTANILLESMNSVMKFLRFTKEAPNDFEDKKLPTLDIKIWIEKMQIWYMFYQKPMCNNIVVQEKSALSESVKVSSLTEEIVRRLKNTRDSLPVEYRMETLEDTAITS